MAQLIKKEKISIVIGEYPAGDGSGTMKKKRRTIGEMVTMQGDDGQQYQFGELWGAGGVSSFNADPQDDNQSQQPAPQQGGYQQQAPQQAPQQQGGYQQAPQHSGHR